MAKKYNYVKNGIQYYRKTKTIGHDLNGNAIKKEGKRLKRVDKILNPKIKTV